MRQQRRPGGHQRGKFRFVFFGDSVLVRCLAISGGFRGVAGGRLRTDSSMKTGTPGRIRTCDLRIRNPLLYPAELRGRETPRDAAGRARDRTAWESRPRPCLSFFFRGGPRHASALKRRIPIRGTTSTQIAAHQGLADAGQFKRVLLWRQGACFQEANPRITLWQPQKTKSDRARA
jgi:hypothetical protein